MPNDPPLYTQETAYSCVPACLRMVLAALGIHETEAKLRELCDCTSLLGGTDAWKLLQGARVLGFHGSEKHNLNIEELATLVSEGSYPIVYLKVRLSADDVYQAHAAVVVHASETIVLHDPLRGRFEMLREDFLQEWRLMRCLTVLVRR